MARMIFEQFRKFYLNVCRFIVLAVALAGLLFVAYCAMRLLGMAFDKVNRAWFTGSEGSWLIITALAIMACGFVAQVIRLRRYRQIQRQVNRNREDQVRGGPRPFSDS